MDEQFDIIVLLQPTTPLRSLETLNQCIKHCVDNSKTVISVSENSKPLQWMFYRQENGIEFVVQQREQLTRRQDCESVYYVNGSVYCMTVDTLLTGSEIFDQNTLTVVSKHREAVDIDTLEDFEYCNYLLEWKAEQ